MENREARKYYNQKNVINELHHKTGYPVDDIARILNSLGDMVKDKCGGDDSYVEIKLFPGLKITSRLIPPQESKSNLNVSECGFILSLNAAFSDYYKQEIRDLHRDTPQLALRR